MNTQPTKHHNVERTFPSAVNHLATSYRTTSTPNIMIAAKPTILLPWSNFISLLFKQESLACILILCVIIISTVIAALSLVQHPASFGLAFISVFSGLVGLVILIFPITSKETGNHWIRDINRSFVEIQEQKIKQLEKQLSKGEYQ